MAPKIMVNVDRLQKKKERKLTWGTLCIFRTGRENDSVLLDEYCSRDGTFPRRMKKTESFKKNHLL